jgi:hypothetical protein
MAYIVRQKKMIKKSQKIIAAEEPINFRIAMSITVCIIGVVSSFFSITFGLTMLGGGVLGLIVNLWARNNRDSPWVTGMENSSSSASSDPRIVKILEGSRAHKMKDKQPRVEQAHEYKKLLDSGLISQHDYQVAMKSLFPHLPSPEQEAQVQERSATE